MAKRLSAWLAHAWRTLRQLSGDDAYERYLTHHNGHGEPPPQMMKQRFFMTVSLSPSSDGTTSHPTKPASGQVVGYLPEGERDDVSLREFHVNACHAETIPLSRKEFFQLQQQRKWSGIKRCC